MTSEPFRSPAYRIIAVPFEKIIPNTYNPNSVAPPEMKLLYLSILEDGYTQPIVCYYSAKQDLYAIVDGFHRWRVMKEHRDIYEREQGMLPVAVIDKPLSNRMASTIRHNRARGSHNVDLMSTIIGPTPGSPSIWGWTRMKSYDSNRSPAWPRCFEM